jgi:hypothetical protein
LKNKVFFTGFFPSKMIGTPSEVHSEPDDTLMAIIPFPRPPYEEKGNNDVNSRDENPILANN